MSFKVLSSSPGKRAHVRGGSGGRHNKVVGNRDFPRTSRIFMSSAFLSSSALWHFFTISSVGRKPFSQPFFSQGFFFAAAFFAAAFFVAAVLDAAFLTAVLGAVFAALLAAGFLCGGFCGFFHNQV